MSKNFALIGASGYVAPRHMQAIKETGNKLICALDPSDSVGIMDRFFTNVDFFTEFERFDRHIEKLRMKNKDNAVHYISICSPNYLHDSHVRFALRSGAHAICEKPLVLNPWNLDALQTLEQRSSLNIYNVLQLRLHASIVALRNKILRSRKENPYKKYDVDLTYITTRGKWYDYSWKGQIEKSGGIATNIGIHFFDMLLWVFGNVKENRVYVNENRKSAGYIELDNARIRWVLSIDKNDLPEQAVIDHKATYRSVKINGKEIEFSGGFTDLHTQVYMHIMNGAGFRIGDTRKSIELAHAIRHAKVVKPGQEEVHPLIK
jgi:UDP-N-acetyl-2-amino-2-deoxyglucuronate dehydrogenase